MPRRRQPSRDHLKLFGNCLEIVPSINNRIDLVIADPPYSNAKLINESIHVCRQKCQGASFFFMYADDIFDLTERPDQVLFWIKPPSTKNTTRRYSRFVEVICAYDLDDSVFNSNDTYWYTRSGVFNDTPVSTSAHPHKKPESLIEKLVAVNSSPGDRVLDPFAGSGTVACVCERMKRDSTSIEIVSRW